MENTPNDDDRPYESAEPIPGDPAAVEPFAPPATDPATDDAPVPPLADPVDKVPPRYHERNIDEREEPIFGAAGSFTHEGKPAEDEATISESAASGSGVETQVGERPGEVNTSGLPDAVVPKRGRPIAHTERRVIPRELIDSGNAGPGPLDANGKVPEADAEDDEVGGPKKGRKGRYKPGYSPQHQPADPLTLGSSAIAVGAFLPTLPPGAEPQPGAPVTPVALDDDEAAEGAEPEGDVTPDPDALPAHLRRGGEGGPTWHQDAAVFGRRTIAGRSYLAGQPDPKAAPQRPIKAREAIPQTALGGPVR